MFEVGKNYLIRTVTMTLTGKLEEVGDKELKLSSAAWVADTGRFAKAVALGDFDEIEPYPEGALVLVGRGAIIDAVAVGWPLPRAVK